MRKKPVVLMILDGYGLNDKVEGQRCSTGQYPCDGFPDEEYPLYMVMPVVWQ